MSEIMILVLILFLYGIVRLLNLSDPASAPKIIVKDRSDAFVKTFLAACPILFETYVPPLLWGKSGHLQTVIYAKLGRTHLSFPIGVRYKSLLPDGATSTFDVFEPSTSHPSGGDYTLVVCPGIANSSEAAYIQTMVEHSRRNGYRVAVLNHMGALKDEPLTAPRIFTYGDTEEFGVMTEKIAKLFPDSKLIAVGFSMGANIVVKYLGESLQHQSYFLCGLSVCQGYDVNAALPLLTSWEGLARGYLYVMTANMKGLLSRHRHQLFGDEALRRYGPVDTRKVFASTTLVDLDTSFTSQRAGFSDVAQFYKWCSCSNYINNITIPLIILNAEDDPIVPRPLLTCPKAFAETHKNCIFVVTKHGGHLGFFEGQFLCPQQVTWLDRAVVQFADAIIAASKHSCFAEEEEVLLKDKLESCNKCEASGSQTLWQRTVNQQSWNSTEEQPAEKEGEFSCE